MKAILLAAGLGTRLRPITDSIPKCLVPIAGRPLLQIWLEQLFHHGVSDVLINTHHFAESVVEFVEQSEFHDRVTLVHESRLLGTAGTLMANLDFFGGQTGLFLHADNFSEVDITELVHAHMTRPTKCILTMTTFIAEDPRSCGIVEVDSQNVITSFIEKPEHPHGSLANGALYVIEPEEFRDFVDAQDFSLDILPHLIGRMYSFFTTKTHIDIGTSNNLSNAQSFLERHRELL